MTLARGLGLGEYYHVYNRGAFKKPVFLEQRDYVRFMFEILYFQSPVQFPHIGRLVSSYTSKVGYELEESEFDSVLQGRYVELVGFCIMPNHYHLLIRELAEGGIARYMQRIGNAYTKYTHAKYGSSGHTFQGRYQTSHVKDSEYLMHLSAYIHRNPRELKSWKGREIEYPWSSYQDYMKENRWGGLLAQEVILDQFEGTKQSNYADFVKSSPAKGFDTSTPY